MHTTYHGFRRHWLAIFGLLYPVLSPLELVLEFPDLFFLLLVSMAAVGYADQKNDDHCYEYEKFDSLLGLSGAS